MKTLITFLFISFVLTSFSANPNSRHPKSMLSTGDETFRSNHVYVENNLLWQTTINYERLTPVNENQFYVYSLGAGIFYGSALICGKMAYSLGQSKNHFEGGVIAQYSGDFIAGAMLAYRYQGKDGWIIRFPIHITNNLDDGPFWIRLGFSIGHSF